MTRNSQPRTFLNTHNAAAFEYPFRCLCPNGILKTDRTMDESRYYHQTHMIEEIIKQVPTLQNYDAGDFPNNIKKWIWSSAEPWHLLCILNNGLYAYFNASRDDDASFDNPQRSQMSLYLSPDLYNLIQYAFTDRTYNLYISQTAPLYALANQNTKKNIVSMMENFALC
jgi:hypothetical protein